MLTPTRVAIFLILLLVVGLAAWSKLRFVDESSQQPQRWRIDEHPRFSSDPASTDPYRR